MSRGLVRVTVPVAVLMASATAGVLGSLHAHLS